MNKKIYFDHNATSFISNKVKDAMSLLPNLPYNPSSTHIYGRESRKILEDSRNKILESVNVRNNNDWNLVFTSSGTEANNLIINNFIDDYIVISSIEHSSIYVPIENLKKYVIDVDSEGLLMNMSLEFTLKNIESRKLLSCILANNETGIIQDIKSISSIAKKYNSIIHTDAVQAYGKIHIDVEDLGIDAITISAHKSGGPIGAACLIYKKSLELNSMVKGGGQERNMRAGTENIPSIYGFGIAAENINENIKLYKNIEILRNEMERKITSISNKIEIVSVNNLRLPNTSMVVMPGISNQSQLIALDLSNIAVSAGSACSSGKTMISKTLISMGYIKEKANCAIRISLGPSNEVDDIDIFIDEYNKIYNRLKN